MIGSKCPGNGLYDTQGPERYLCVYVYVRKTSRKLEDKCCFGLMRLYAEKHNSDVCCRRKRIVVDHDDKAVMMWVRMRMRGKSE